MRNSNAAVNDVGEGTLASRVVVGELGSARLAVRDGGEAPGRRALGGGIALRLGLGDGDVV